MFFHLLSSPMGEETPWICFPGRCALWQTSDGPPGQRHGIAVARFYWSLVTLISSKRAGSAPQKTRLRIKLQLCLYHLVTNKKRPMPHCYHRKQCEVFSIHALFRANFWKVLYLVRVFTFLTECLHVFSGANLPNPGTVFQEHKDIGLS